MQIDLFKLDVAQARCGKALNKLGIPPETIRNVKRGKNVRPTTVHKFASALGCEIEDIIKNVEDVIEDGEI